MYNAGLHSFCSEFYTVEKSIEVVVSRKGKAERVRIDALKDEKMGHYCARAYIEENVTLQPTFPQSNGKYDRAPQDFRIWVVLTQFPWTHRSSADSVLSQALGFLKESCN